MYFIFKSTCFANNSFVWICRCDASSGITLSFEHIHGPTKMMKLQQLAQQFGITISYDKDIVGTYLVADCETILTRTKLVGWALLLNIPIVTFQWVVDSLAAMSLQPVVCIVYKLNNYYNNF